MGGVTTEGREETLFMEHLLRAKSILIPKCPTHITVLPDHPGGSFYSTAHITDEECKAQVNCDMSKVT